MKLIQKFQYGRPLVVQSDNTRVAKPIIKRKIKYKLKLGEFFFTDRNTGKKTLIKPKNETISADRRNTYQRKQNEKRTQQLHKQYEEDKKQEEGMKNLQGLLTFVSPSTYVGPVFNNNGKSYTENVMSGKGTGSAAGNIAIDMLTPFAVGGAKSLTSNPVTKYLFKRRQFKFPYLADLNYSSPAYSMNVIKKAGWSIVYRLLKHGIAGMRVTPLRNIDHSIPKIMDNHVFSRLGISPSQKFYSNIYRGNKTFMESVNPNITGMYTSGNRIIIKEGASQVEILPHELRHKLDDIYNLSDEQQQILNKAYSNDFNSDEIKKTVGRDLSYNMLDEAVTTNLDSRRKLFDAYNPSSNDTYFPIDLQNDMIDKMSDEKIIYAIQNSNRYGQVYIDYLKQNNLLTKDKVQAFRNAMKYVGGISIPAAIETSTQR